MEIKILLNDKGNPPGMIPTELIEALPRGISIEECTITTWTLPKGAVRYLGYRTDLNAQVFAVNSASGAPPMEMAKMIAAVDALAINDLVQKVDAMASRLEAWAESHDRLARISRDDDQTKVYRTVAENYRTLAGGIRALIAREEPT